MKWYIRADANSSLGKNNTVPTYEDIVYGIEPVTYGGLPVKYNPNMHADARNRDTFIEVSDKFFNYSYEQQQHILNHEVAHNLSDRLMSEHSGDWNEFASKFIKEKQVPETSDAYKRGMRTYWEGLYGDIGATSLSETTTHAIVEYFDDPNRLLKRSKEAYDIIDEFVTRVMK